MVLDIPEQQTYKRVRLNLDPLWGTAGPIDDSPCLPNNADKTHMENTVTVDLTSPDLYWHMVGIILMLEVKRPFCT